MQAGSEAVDAVLAAASALESSNAVLPALLSLDSLFEECLRPHPPLIAALARPDAIRMMVHLGLNPIVASEKQRLNMIGNLV